MEKPVRKIIVVIPAGRRRYLEILIPYLLREADVIDEIHFWCNTGVKEDIEFMEGWVETNPELFKLVKLSGVKSYAPTNICKFFKPYQKENEVYIRIDDDVVFLEEGFIKSLAKFRIENPQYFLVYGNTLNNVIIDYHYQKQTDLLNTSQLISSYKHQDPIGWGNPQIAEEKHRLILEQLQKNNAEVFRIKNKVLKDYEHCTVNCISWLGEELQMFNADIHEREEKFLSVWRPQSIEKPNIVYGEGKVCVHYAFNSQREYLDSKTDILKAYKKLNDNSSNT